MTSVTLSVSAPVTERIDRFLADQLSISRTQAARLVATGCVTVNGELARRSRKLDRADKVEINFPEDDQTRVLEPHRIELDIVYEDDCLLIINKPAGLVVHPAPGHWNDTLVNALVSRGCSLSPGEPGRPGVVHRLDKDTSGLLIIAKGEGSHRALATAIARREVTRQYAALVWGHLGEAREIDVPVGRHPRDRKRMIVLSSGKEARTSVEPIARFSTCDLVRLKLATGRTHQIRVHLAHIGHPIVGDQVYSGGGPKRASGPQRPLSNAIDASVGRQSLHAARLEFAHPETRERMDIWAEWPTDLRKVMATAAEQIDLLERPDVLEYLGFFE